jgi:predicted DNA-binding transcriptional regulator YafY
MARADRLLQLMLLLQTHGRLTAAELARKLEVSVRTVQRDLESLSGSGIPVYSVRGGQGGWALVEGFRTNLTGLTPDEAVALAVAGPDSVARDLGMERGSTSGWLKVLAALPSLGQQVVQHARERVHVDLLPWGGQPEGVRAVLARLYQAASGDSITLIRYGTADEPFEIAPLGLVAKGLVWYLVALRGTDIRTYRVPRIANVQLTDRRFDRPADFRLAEHWDLVCERLIETFPGYEVRLRTTEIGLQRLRWSGARILRSRQRAGQVDVTVDLEAAEEARAAILSLGAGTVVIHPVELATSIADTARSISRSYDRDAAST